MNTNEIQQTHLKEKRLPEILLDQPQYCIENYVMYELTRKFTQKHIMSCLLKKARIVILMAKNNLLRAQTWSYHATKGTGFEYFIKESPWQSIYHNFCLGEKGTFREVSFLDDMNKEQRIELFHKLLTDKNYYIFDSSDGVSEWCVDKVSLARIIRKIIKGQRDDFQYLKVYISYSDEPCAENFMAEAVAIDFLKKNPEYYI